MNVQFGGNCCRFGSSTNLKFQNTLPSAAMPPATPPMPQQPFQPLPLPASPLPMPSLPHPPIQTGSRTALPTALMPMAFGNTKMQYGRFSMLA